MNNFNESPKNHMLRNTVLAAGLATTAILGANVLHDTPSDEEIRLDSVHSGHIERKLHITVPAGTEYYTTPATINDGGEGVDNADNATPEDLVLNIDNPVVVKGTDGHSYVMSVVKEGQMAPTDLPAFAHEARVFRFDDVEKHYDNGADREIPELILGDTLPRDADQVTPVSPE